MPSHVCWMHTGLLSSVSIACCTVAYVPGLHRHQRCRPSHELSITSLFLPLSLPTLAPPQLPTPTTQAAEYADAVAQIAALSAAVLFPCSRTPASAFLPAGVGAAAAGGLGSPPAAAAGASADEAEAVADATAPPNPLFNTRALQLWILRGCQQLKGGLRDKPGKSPDYYHTCYCLSGLTAAQHMEGGCVVGPDTLHSVDVQGGSSSSSSSSSSRRGAGSSNELAAADPLLNVLVGKVEEAKLFFESAGKVV